ncbi:hypothetical protein MLD38_006818 [Melastoma candidum]|uniref:Uncharacterized protein n=1 Tax=Melastoma candidum TaxID=119954 RepID=A0ACB9RQZ6_9MYRT|nr:hypothetical protein MLD38_006818 [Melastoma candidum]
MSMVFRSISATNYTVGDSFGWNTPSNGVSTYTTWASGHTFHVGDVLVFNFVTGNHDVARVTQSDYNNCNTGSPLSIMTTSPVDYVLNVTGSYYFICTYHCSQGQKLQVTVDSSSGTTYGPPPPPPPPRSSASSTSTAHAVASCVMSIVLQKLAYGRI